MIEVMYRLLVLIGVAVSTSVHAEQFRVATFNVSMEATNYVEPGASVNGSELFELLKSGQHQQVKNVAEIIQSVRPDIILLNEFDYTRDARLGIKKFVQKFLRKAHNNHREIDFPYFYTAPVNTGLSTGIKNSNDENDLHGFGRFEGHYGMALLSRYPIITEGIRTFQRFLWKDMPDSLMTEVKDKNGEQWFSEEVKQVLRLSSKSHWDIPININGRIVHILASHPTPPVFDGPENRNGKRNHDEIRFWVDYLSKGEEYGYFYDDKGLQGGFSGKAFVLLGDLNSSPDEGDSNQLAIRALLDHKRVNGAVVPTSEGGKQNLPNNPYASTHTASWGMRADYVLPSNKGLTVTDSGVFWPVAGHKDHRLIKNRNASSDHRLVWLDLNLSQ